MRIQVVVLALLLLVLSACDGGAAASVPPTTSPTTAVSPVGSVPPIATGVVVDLSGVDACALLDEPTVRALTGLTDVKLHAADQPQDTECFWGVTDPNVPQYVEISVLPRPDGLDAFTLTIGEGCTIVAVAGVGAESSGGICTDPQKVYLFAWDRGVAVKVLVNEPKSALTPADLVATAAAVLEDLAIP